MTTNLVAQTVVFIGVAVAGVISVVMGLRTGSASNFIPGGFKRSEHPLQYWSAIVMSGAAVVAALFVLATSIQ